MTLEQLLAALGIPTGAGAIAGLVMLLVRWLRAGGERRLRRTATVLLGDGETPGLFATVKAHGEQLAAQGQTLDAIRAQLEPNHGGSLHDVVVEIRTLVRDQGRRLDEHIASPHPPVTWPVNQGVPR